MNKKQKMPKPSLECPEPGIEGSMCSKTGARYLRARTRGPMHGVITHERMQTRGYEDQNVSGIKNPKFMHVLPRFIRPRTIVPEFNKPYTIVFIFQQATTISNQFALTRPRFQDSKQNIFMHQS
jgi:hypothetical protein